MHSYKSTYYYGSTCAIRPNWVNNNYCNKTGKNITVAVIDSGCDKHMISDSRLVDGLSFVKKENDFIYELSNDYYDNIGHGTICIDRILKIVPDVRIIPLKIFNNELETNCYIMSKALNYAIEKKVNVINMSLCTTLEKNIEYLYYVCEKAKNNGIIIVAASPCLETKCYPASFDNVISVGSNKSLDVFDYYYNEENAIECIANGYLGNDAKYGGSYINNNYSSFATPIITGIVSLFLGNDSKLSLKMIRKLLRKYSIKRLC
jgi:subtilisin family serine protease